MPTTDIFPTKIYTDHFDDYDLLARLCKEVVSRLDLTNDHPILHHGMYSTWPKGTQQYVAEEFGPIIEFVERSAKQYWRDIGYINGNVHIRSSCVNVVNPGGKMESHHHGKDTMAAVLYLDSTPERGNIVFEDPKELILCGQPLANLTQQINYEVPSNTGDLLIMPGSCDTLFVPIKQIKIVLLL